MIKKWSKESDDTKTGFKNGADALVIGRSITSGNIKNNIKKIINELK